MKNHQPSGLIRFRSAPDRNNVPPVPDPAYVARLAAGGIRGQKTQQQTSRRGRTRFRHLGELVKRSRGKKLPLTVGGVHALRAGYVGTLEPAGALAAGVGLPLGRFRISDFFQSSALDLQPLYSPPRSVRRIQNGVAFNRIFANLDRRNMPLCGTNPVSESEPLWKAGVGFAVRDLALGEEKLPSIPSFEFENWAVLALGGIPSKVQVRDMGAERRIYPVSSSAPSRTKQEGELALKGPWYPSEILDEEIARKLA